MRRSICYCSPSTTLAGKINTWKFIYTPATNLPKGARLTFDLGSSGRDIDWQVPSVDLTKASNVIYAKLENGKPISAKEVNIAGSYTPQFEFTLPSELQAGSSFTIIVGSAKEGPGTAHKNGTRAQTMAQRRRTFTLNIDTSTKGKSKPKTEEPEVFTMDVRGSELSRIIVLTPSYVVRNRRFDVTVVLKINMVISLAKLIQIPLLSSLTNIYGKILIGNYLFRKQALSRFQIYISTIQVSTP